MFITTVGVGWTENLTRDKIEVGKKSHPHPPDAHRVCEDASHEVVCGAGGRCGKEATTLANWARQGRSCSNSPSVVESRLWCWSSILRVWGEYMKKEGNISYAQGPIGAQLHKMNLGFLF
jgi:hypothetical protein